MLRRLLREPLVHFLAIGLLLFVAFDRVGGDRGATGRTIVVDDAIVADLVRRHAAVWQRPPTPAELDGLVNGWVRDGIAYREGLELRLDRDDPLIRRRVHQKVDVLMRYERLDATAQLERILPVAPVFTVQPSPGPWEVALTYTKIGIGHILMGVDPLLFVLALVMIVRGRRMLLVTITAFTVAHSITRALAGGVIDRRFAVIAPAYLIGGIANYWVFERVAGFMG